jgi:hypothetical protein
MCANFGQICLLNLISNFLHSFTFQASWGALNPKLQGRAKQIHQAIIARMGEFSISIVIFLYRTHFCITAWLGTNAEMTVNKGVLERNLTWKVCMSVVCMAIDMCIHWLSNVSLFHAFITIDWFLNLNSHVVINKQGIWIELIRTFIICYSPEDIRPSRHKISSYPHDLNDCIDEDFRMIVLMRISEWLYWWGFPNDCIDEDFRMIVLLRICTCISFSPHGSHFCCAIYGRQWCMYLHCWTRKNG